MTTHRDAIEPPGWIGPFVVLGLVLFAPRARAADLHVLFTVLAATLAVVLLCGRRPLPVVLRNLVLMSFASISYALLIGLLRQSPDLSVPYVMMIFLAYCLAGYFLFHIYVSRFRKPLEQFSLHLGVWGALHALPVFVSLASEGVRAWMYAHLELNWNETWVALGHRGVDVTIGGGAMGAAVFATIATWYGLSAYIFGWRGARLLPLPVLVVAAVLLGRSALVLLPLAALLGYVAVRRSHQVRRTGRLPVLNLAVASTVAVAGLYCVVALLGINISTPGTVEENLLPWLQEPLAGERASGTTGLLLSFSTFFLPESASGQIFGLANAGRHPALPYVATDVGFVRSIFAVGILGSLLVYLPLAYLFIWSLRRLWTGPAAAGVLLFTSSMLVMNFKEWHIVWRSGTTVLVVLLLFAAEAARDAASPDEREPHGADRAHHDPRPGTVPAGRPLPSLR